MKLLTLGCALVLLTSHAWTQQPKPENVLFHEKSLSRDIAYVQVAEQLKNPFYKSDIIGVNFLGAYANCPPTPQSECAQYLLHPSGFARHLKDLKLQVWLLKTDGTTLKQKDALAGGVCNAGECEDSMMFVFEHVPPTEIAGLVVLADGKLIPRTFSASDIPHP